jgi:hypothetical protein
VWVCAYLIIDAAQSQATGSWGLLEEYKQAAWGVVCVYAALSLSLVAHIVTKENVVLNW